MMVRRIGRVLAWLTVSVAGVCSAVAGLAALAWTDPLHWRALSSDGWLGGAVLSAIVLPLVAVLAAMLHRERLGRRLP